MKLEEVVLEDAVEERTRAFVEEQHDFITRALGRSEDTMAKSVRKLKGAEGLLLRKQFGEASELWKKFLWYRIAEHHLTDARSLEDSIRLAEQDLLALEMLRHPM
jgi:hypothetical protein